MIEQRKPIIDDKILATNILMTMVQMARDSWVDFANNDYAKRFRWESAMIKDEFRKLSTAIERGYRNAGHIQMYEEMNNIIADNADEVVEFVRMIDLEMQNKLVQAMPFEQQESFRHLAKVGTFTNIANQMYELMTGRGNRFFENIENIVGDVAEKYDLWKDVQGICNGKCVNDMIARVAQICSKGSKKRENKTGNNIIPLRYDKAKITAKMDEIAQRMGMTINN